MTTSIQAHPQETEIIKHAALAGLLASVALLAACGGSGDNPPPPPLPSPSTPAPTAWIAWVGNANGEIIKDLTNDSFKVRASDRVVVFMGNMSELNGTYVDTSANLYINSALIGNVSPATSTAGTEIAVFRCTNGRILDFYNDTPTTYTWNC
jgi:hypothetical protein